MTQLKGTHTCFNKFSIYHIYYLADCQYTLTSLLYRLKAKFGKYLELEPMRSRILLEYAKIDLKEEKALKLQEDIEAGLIQPPSEELPKQPKKASAITYGGQALKIREKKNVPLVRM